MTQKVIALLAEYDALPEIGHGCRHNLIASAAVGTAVELRSIFDEVEGTIQVIVTALETHSYGEYKELVPNTFLVNASAKNLESMDVPVDEKALYDGVMCTLDIGEV